jgi:hypothetical protein
MNDKDLEEIKQLLREISVKLDNLITAVYSTA